MAINFQDLPQKIQDWLYSDELSSGVEDVSKKYGLGLFERVAISRLLYDISIRELAPSLFISALIIRAGMDFGAAEQIALDIVKLFRPLESEFKALGVDVNAIAVISQETREKILAEILEKQKPAEKPLPEAAKEAPKPPEMKPAVPPPQPPTPPVAEKPAAVSAGMKPVESVAAKKPEAAPTHITPAQEAKPEEPFIFYKAKPELKIVEEKKEAPPATNSINKT